MLQTKMRLGEIKISLNFNYFWLRWKGVGNDVTSRELLAVVKIGLERIFPGSFRNLENVIKV